MECTVCLSTKKEEDVCVCATCKGAGIICHDCVQAWEAAGHNPWICTICKNPKGTMRNIPYSLYPNAIQLLITLPRTAIEAQFRVLEQFNGFGWLVTLYGIILLIAISVITFMFTYVTILLSIGIAQHFIGIAQHFIGIAQHLVLAVESTVLTIEHII